MRKGRAENEQFGSAGANGDDFYFDPHIWYQEATAEQIEANHRLKLEMEAAEAKAKTEEKAKKATSKNNNKADINGN